MRQKKRNCGGKLSHYNPIFILTGFVFVRHVLCVCVCVCACVCVRISGKMDGLLQMLNIFNQITLTYNQGERVEFQLFNHVILEDMPLEASRGT